MKKRKDISVELFRVEGDMAPFVEVDYLDKYADEHVGLMMIDSGSNKSFLVSSMSDAIGELCDLHEVTDNIVTITGECVTAGNVRFSFAMGGRQFSEPFCINDKVRLNQVNGGAPVIGLLGIDFMLRHSFALDYSDFTLHTSHAGPSNLTIADCDFFFPMEIGLRFYNIPVLRFTQNGIEAVALADTGSNSNLISEKTLQRYGFSCEYLGTTNAFTGLTGETRCKAKGATMDFCLTTLREQDTASLTHHDSFIVPQNDIIIPEKEDFDKDSLPLDPIGIVISAPFMAKEKWTLDFGAKIIYKRSGMASYA